MKLEEIAERIHAHLKRFENDPAINAPDSVGLRRYYYPSAFRAGRYVKVGYISYHGKSALTKAEAVAYLAWLDAGNVGTHYRQQDEEKKLRAHQ